MRRLRLQTLIDRSREEAPARFAEDRVAKAHHLLAIEQAIASIEPDVAALQDWYRIYAQSNKKRLAFDLGYVERFAKGGARILEFGSMPPILTVALTRLGYSVCGLDLAPARFQSVLCNEGVEVREVDFEVMPLPFEDESADVVIFNEVFEHLRINPIFTFSEISRVLKAQGTLLLSTPNLTSLRGWYNFAIKSRTTMSIFGAYEKLDSIGHVGHVRLYSPSEVTLFLRKMGFAVHEIVYRGQWESPTPGPHTLLNAILRLFPRSRTYFSIFAKPAAIKAQ